MDKILLATMILSIAVLIVGLVFMFAL